MIKVLKNIELKNIELHDAGRLNKLMHQIYTPVYQHLWQDKGQWYLERFFGAEQLKIELAQAASPYYFVFFKNDLIGILRVQHLKSTDKPQLNITKLHRLYLAPDLHNLGLGKALLDFTIQQAKLQGLQQVFLEVMDSQEQALNFYKKNGFELDHPFRLTFSKMHRHYRGMYKMTLTLT